jgi:hypothetical protein
MRGLILYVVGYLLGNAKARQWIIEQASLLIKEKKDDDVSKTD